MDANHRQVVGAVFGGLLGFGLVWAIESKAWPPPNSAAPNGSLRLAACVGVISLAYTVGGIVQRRRQRDPKEEDRSARARLRRPNKTATRQFLVWQALLMGFLFLLCRPRHWTYESVGFDAEWPIVPSFLAGASVYGVFLAALTWVLHVTGRFGVQADNNLTTLAKLWPRRRRQKCEMMIAVCLLNPLTEELLFRGILVHQLSVATGWLAAPIAIGCLANLGNHAYQGPRAVATHLPFYAIAVALLFGPTGLWGSLGFHFAGDVVPVVTMKRALREYRERRRRS